MSKHTPGPWKVVGDRVCIGVVPMYREGGETKSREMFYEKSTAHGETFAYDSDVCPSWEANARLIAAAPDLLELALYVRGCLDETGECVIKIGQPMDGIVTKLIAKAAIAKAEGKTK